MFPHDRFPHLTSRASAVLLRLRTALIATLVLAATAVAVIVGTTSPASAGPTPVMTGYVPLPADDFQAYLEAISTQADATLDFTVGVTNAATGSVMYYDQWEDGFEADLANPAQSSTLVFGDDDDANGDASDFCDVCTGDQLPQGAALIMRNDISTPRDTSVRFDGGDKVASTRGFAITAGGFSTPHGSVLSGVVSAYDVSKYGTRFTVPVGEDTPFPSGATDPFEYAGASIMAAQDGTVVEIDRDGDGTPEVVETIEEGEASFAAGLLQQGATIRSSLPVQVHLLTGNRNSSFEARSYTLFPDDVLSSDYMSPAGSGLSSARTVNYLYNPSATSLPVSPTCTGCSGTITVPANASASFTSPLNQAVRFQSSGGRPFIAIAGIGAQNSTSDAAAFDWGYPMIPTSQLTTQVVLGWAPGNSANPPSTSGTQYRYDPVWVTSLAATTVRVDYDGDPSTGTITTDDCFGSNHDAEISVAALASTRIFDQADGDMTGARIYTCDGTQLAGAWGQDPASSHYASPGFDAGYTIIPTTTMLVEKSATLVEDVDGDGGFGPGDTMTYEIAIADAGSLAFTDVQLEDVLPPGLEYVPDSTYLEVDGDVTPIADDQVPPASTAFPLDDNVGLPDIAAGATVYVRFDTAITAPWSLDSNVLGNTACVVANEAQACDTSQTTLTTADVSLTKLESSSPAYVGEQATFELTVANAGPDAAPGVEVEDVLPAGLTFVDAVATQGSYDDATGLWTVGELAVDGEATLTITATVDSIDPITNVAEVVGGSFVDPDSTPDNGDPDEDDQDSALVHVEPLVDLELTKEQTGDPTHLGNEATFEVTVANTGPSPATNVEVTDLLPAGLTFVEAAATQGTYVDATGVWTVGDLAVDGDATLTITATVDQEDEAITNVAQVSYVDQDDRDSTPANDDPEEDDQASAGVSVGPLVDLSLSKTQTGGPTHVGDAATYVVTVHNDGPSDATGVEVTDLLPSGVVHDSHDTTQGTYDPVTGLWTVGALDAGDSATLVIEATVDALSATNVAEVTAVVQDDADSQPAEDPLGPTDPPNQDDEGSAPLTLAALADLSVEKVETADPTHVGDDAVFEVTVHNGGPSPAIGVEVTDLLPAGLTFRQADASQGIYDDTTGIWTVGALAVDGDATLTITARVDEQGRTTNVAELTDVDQDDPDSTPNNDDPDEDDQDDAEVEVDPLIDLELVKSASAPTNQDEQGTFTLTLTNDDGPSDAAGVQVTDLLPAGVTYEGDDSGGDYNPETGIWNVGAVNVGATRTLVITVTVDDLEVTNYAQVSAAAQDDIDSEPGSDELSSENPPDQDDESEASMRVAPTADLELTKSASPDEVDQGDSTTFAIVVSNKGPSTATNVVVEDVLPAGVTATGVDASQGSWSTTTGIWTVGTLAVDQTATLEITVRVDDAGDDIRNVAEVTAVDQHDPDSTPGNDDPDEDDQDDASITSEAIVDLEVTKSVPTGQEAVHVGDEVTYTVTVANDGPSDATGVELTDVLPAGVTYEADDSGGDYDPTTGVWDVGDVEAGDSVSLAVTVTVVAAGDITNVAEVTDVEEDDVDSTPDNGVPTEDDQDDVTIEGIQIDLELDIEASASEVDVGDEVVFTVTLANRGPNPATGVSVADLLPPGLTFVGTSTATGGYADGLWTVGGLAVDQTVTLLVTAQVTASGPLAYGAQVETAIEPDLDSTPANDVADEDDQDVVAIVGIEADLSLTKTVDDASPGLGDQVTYTLTLANAGPAGATGVVVEDVLPAGVEWVSDTSGGAYDPATGRWTVGSLANGASVELDITVRTTSSDPVVNRASVVEVDQPDPTSTPGNDDPTEDDEDTVTVEAEPAAVSGRVWLDVDGDSRFDDGESPIEEVAVLLLDRDGDVVASMLTDGEGRYAFTDLPPDGYMVVIDEDTLPAIIDGQTYDPDDVVDGQHEVVLVAGATVVDVDFGYVPAQTAFDEIEQVVTDLAEDVLARTGTDVWWQLRAGLTLLLLGGGLLLAARRRRPGAA